MTEFRKLTESSNVHLPMPELTLNSIEKLLEEERRLLARVRDRLSTPVDEAEKLSLALETITGVSSECDVVTDEDCISWKQYADAVADVSAPGHSRACAASFAGALGCWGCVGAARGEDLAPAHSDGIAKRSRTRS